MMIAVAVVVVYIKTIKAERCKRWNDIELGWFWFKKKQLGNSNPINQNIISCHLRKLTIS
jgi:hypothetical protein